MTLKSLEKKGYYGADASLDISLFEYGLAIKPIKNKGYHIIFGVSYDMDIEEYTTFSSTMMSESELPVNESWVDMKSVMKLSGYSEKCFNDADFIIKLDSLISYYGKPSLLGDPLFTFEIKKKKK